MEWKFTLRSEWLACGEQAYMLTLNPNPVCKERGGFFLEERVQESCARHNSSSKQSGLTLQGTGSVCPAPSGYGLKLRAPLSFVCQSSCL